MAKKRKSSKSKEKELVVDTKRKKKESLSGNEQVEDKKPSSSSSVTTATTATVARSVEPSPPPTEEEWACGTCTYQNSNKRTHCDMCGTRNPAAAASIETNSEEKQDGPSLFWDCGACTLRNPTGCTNCQICGTPNPDAGKKMPEWECEDCEVLNTSTCCQSCDAPIPHSVLIDSQGSSMAYGGISVSDIEELLDIPNKKQILVDKLQVVTHNLAMAVATAGEQLGNPFGPFSSVSSKRHAEDSKLLKCLCKVLFSLEQNAEARLLASQALNYIMKLNPRTVHVACDENVTKLYLKTLKASTENPKFDERTWRLLVEEALAGLKILCDAFSPCVHEFFSNKSLETLLFFLNDDNWCKSSNGILLAALGILKKVCAVMKPVTNSSATKAPVASAKRKGKSSYASRFGGSEVSIEVVKSIVVSLSRVLDHDSTSIKIAALKCISSMYQRAHSFSLPLKDLVDEKVILKFSSLLAVTSDKDSLKVQGACVEILIQILKISPSTTFRLISLNLEKPFVTVFRNSLGTSSLSSLSSNLLTLIDIMIKVLCMVPASDDAVRNDDVVKNDTVMLKSGKQLATVVRLRNDGKYVVLLQDSKSELVVSKDEIESRVISASVLLYRPLLNVMPDSQVRQTYFLNFVRADETSMVQRLSRNGFWLNDPNAAIVAVRYASCNMLRILIGLGVELNYVGSSGTALHIAAAMDKKDFVEMLVLEGASLKIKDKEDKLPIDVAKGLSLEYLKKQKVVNRKPSSAALFRILQGDDQYDASEYSEDEDDDVAIISHDDMDSEASSTIIELGDDEEVFLEQKYSSSSLDPPSGSSDSTKSCPKESVKSEKGVSWSPTKCQQKQLSDMLLTVIMEWHHLCMSKQVQLLVSSRLVYLLEVAPASLFKNLPIALISEFLEIIRASLNKLLEAGTSGNNNNITLHGLRILQVLARKCDVGSAVFSQIERRGVSELVRQVSSKGKSKRSALTSSQTLQKISQLVLNHIELKQSQNTEDSMESKLKLLCSKMSSKKGCHQAMKDLLVLLGSEEGITSHEFQAAKLPNAMLTASGFSCDDENKEVSWRAITDFRGAFFSEGHCGISNPTSEKVVQLLKEILAATEKFEASNVKKSKQIGLLSSGIKIELARKTAVSSSQLSGSSNSASASRMVVTQPLVKFHQLEKTILRSVIVADEKYLCYSYSLVTHCIWRKINQRWVSYVVRGYDARRGVHLLYSKTSSNSEKGALEARLSDETYRLDDVVIVKACGFVSLNNYDLNWATGALAKDTSASQVAEKNTRKRTRASSSSSTTGGGPSSKKRKGTSSVSIPITTTGATAMPVVSEVDSVGASSLDGTLVGEKVWIKGLDAIAKEVVSEHVGFIPGQVISTVDNSYYKVLVYLQNFEQKSIVVSPLQIVRLPKNTDSIWSASEPNGTGSIIGSSNTSGDLEADITGGGGNDIDALDSSGILPASGLRRLQELRQSLIAQAREDPSNPQSEELLATLNEFRLATNNLISAVNPNRQLQQGLGEEGSSITCDSSSISPQLSTDTNSGSSKGSAKKFKTFSCSQPPKLCIALAPKESFNKGRKEAIQSLLLNANKTHLSDKAEKAFRKIFHDKAIKPKRVLRSKKSRAGSAAQGKTPDHESFTEDYLTCSAFKSLLSPLFSPEFTSSATWLTRLFAKNIVSSKKKKELVLEEKPFLASMLSLSKDASSVAWRFLVQENYSETYFNAPKVSTKESPVVYQKFSSEDNLLKCVSNLRKSDGTVESLQSIMSSVVRVYYKVDIDWPSRKEKSTSCAKQDSTFYRDLNDSLEPSFVKLDRTKSLSNLPKDFVDALELLALFFQSSSSEQEISDTWKLSSIESKVESHLHNYLSLATGSIPNWVFDLAVQCKFLFSLNVRNKIFRASAFGWQRAMQWLLDQSSSNSSRDRSSGEYNINLPPLRKERAKIQRNDLVKSAEKAIQHSSSKFVLDIVFVGERGYGSGVTASFYSALAEKLYSTAENTSVPCWISGEEMTDDLMIAHPFGLFPKPFKGSSINRSVIKRFEWIGKYCGKCLVDNRIFPLPLSTYFLSIVMGQKIKLVDLPRIFLQPGRIILRLLKAHKAVVIERKTDYLIDNMSLPSWLEAADLCFLDPVTENELVPDGANKTVSLENLGYFLKLVLESWLGSGIKKQVEAFRKGLSEIVPLENLDVFTPSELGTLIRGSSDVDWEMSDLVSNVKPGHGYTQSSVPYLNFLKTLVEMTVEERREFLLFSTGCPSLPPGGLSALSPLFEVTRRQVTAKTVDEEVPFARTCTNTLHLPPYSTEKVLSERLTYAIKNSKGVIDRD